MKGFKCLEPGCHVAVFYTGGDGDREEAKQIMAAHKRYEHTLDPRQVLAQVEAILEVTK